MLASRTLGAGRLDTLLTIVVPLSMRGVAAGSSLIFARSLGEFGATIVVAKEGVMAKEGVRSKH